MSHGHHIIPMKTLINTILALLVLTILTVVAAQIDVGSHALHTLIAVIIASAMYQFRIPGSSLPIGKILSPPPFR